ncbi:Cytochrome P450 monooxygenase aclL [Colletotrichum gloeosporioides]|uniref:Cytochrome P450 monooxygenase aclL n=1 Tax=Colletotrichum gloeosporioides TaxID=474922 RepID=A0A8H4CL58_COLGL|nr:Cytochrome P450 monooxygenase aclL [Colletotrichum gloeosporioides]KAF3805980.1 Cytochrome P450 monooxygenase aclL [Colletotrichum gloeosporioides]
MEKESECLTMEEQYANGFLFMTAGTDTIASALSAITFYLLRNPHHLDRVTNEVRSKFSTSEHMSLEALASLPYLQAVIQEGLRLHPPLPVALPRVIPKGGARVGGEWVPGGTIVGIHFLSIHTQELYFKNALEFHPQRWLHDPEFKDDQLDMAKPFLMGPFNCIGKVWGPDDLPSTLLASLFLNFDVRLSQGSFDWNKMKVYTLWQKKPLLCELLSAKSKV